MAKKQGSLSGFELEGIEAIDSAAAKHIKALEEEKVAKNAVKLSNSIVLAAMGDNTKKLKKDADGNHVYVYKDGELSMTFMLHHKDSLKIKNKKISQDDSDKPAKTKGKGKKKSKPILSIASEPAGDIG